MSTTDCIIEALAEGMANGEIEKVVVISPGKPCTCGPGFCANDAGLGHYGVCSGSEGEAGPDCDHCGAPHQRLGSRCWLCADQPNGSEPTDLLLLEHGIRSNEVFGYQDRLAKQGRFVSFEEATSLMIDERGT